MKKLIAVLLIVAMVCCMFTVTALARNPIISPEQPNIEEPEIPTNPTEPVEPTEPVGPTSPQTGGVNVSVFVVAAVLLCGVSVVVLRKAVIA